MVSSVFSITGMLKRLLPAFIILTFASQVFAGAVACTKGDHNSPAEMACCAQAKMATASPAAVICCQTACGEPTSGNAGTQSENTVRPPVPVSTVAIYPVVMFTHVLPIVAHVFNRRNGLDLKHDPPALYLHNSSFLI